MPYMHAQQYTCITFSTRIAHALSWLVDPNIYGPFKVRSPDGSKYYVGFFEGFSRRIFSYTIKAIVKYSVSLKSSNCRWRNRQADG